ncbi:uncharacterized protein BDZ99DRAFT_458014 [Mytilinidion resinicola]|uniref:Uncharacterized protein n=1 Tax=Mytilinidion resinicola TaxID=574789 RepID=A0A6A6Z500_9PEZI|nr:uncharacterized protein BDZ99DRAFT_458014 [Mytilinidion resinicola]KAF2816100.1 hypothetical protein BDZ99DRAFT_458014 [Mytilinidion resinicola]
MWALGLGSVNINSLVSSSSNGSFQGPLISMVLTPNFPQPIISLLYLAYNSLIIVIHVSVE